MIDMTWEASYYENHRATIQNSPILEEVEVFDDAIHYLP
jgi:hypothetical protein